MSIQMRDMMTGMTKEEGRERERGGGDTVVYHSSFMPEAPPSPISPSLLPSLSSPSLLFSLDFSHSAHFLITVVPSYSFFLFTFLTSIRKMKIVNRNTIK